MWVLAEDGLNPTELFDRPKHFRLGNGDGYAPDIFDHPAWDDASRAVIGIYPATLGPDAPNQFYREDVDARLPGPITGGVSEVARTYISLDLNEAKQRAKMQIKGDAQRRIFNGMSDYKQRNALFAMLEAILAHGLDPVAWPGAVKTEHQRVIGLVQDFKAIRNQSNQSEADVDLAVDVDAVDLVQTSIVWPI